MLLEMNPEKDTEEAEMEQEMERECNGEEEEATCMELSKFYSWIWRQQYDEGKGPSRGGRDCHSHRQWSHPQFHLKGAA